MGACYLIHFSAPIGNLANRRGQAQHYLGWTGKDSLHSRLARHRSGNGAAIMAAVARAGVAWQVVRTWPGANRALETKLKAAHNARRLCPVCNPKLPRPRPGLAKYRKEQVT